MSYASPDIFVNHQIARVSESPLLTFTYQVSSNRNHPSPTVSIDNPMVVLWAEIDPDRTHRIIDETSDSYTPLVIRPLTSE